MRCFSQLLYILDAFDFLFNLQHVQSLRTRLTPIVAMDQNNHLINYQHPQYSQQGYQQSVFTNRYGNAQYQPYPAQPLGQQNSTQQFNQIPMHQAMNTQTPLSNVSTPLHQQWTQQYNQQAPTAQPPTMTNASYSQMQLGQATLSGQWQTGSNTTTTTTQTTTTKKSSKQTKSQLPNTTSTVTDFSKLMQQPPRQQQSQTQSTNQYSNMTQTLTSPMPMPIQTQSTTSFSHLMQAAPPPQPIVPTAQPPSPPPPVVPAPQPPPNPPAKPSNHPKKREKHSVISSNSATQKTTSNFKPHPTHQPPHPITNANTSSSTKTTATNKTTTKETVVGSTSRQQAAQEGTRELRRFDQHVTARMLLLSGSQGVCPMEYDWYAVEEGYLCGGGNHFVTHEDVEAMLTRGAVPMIQFVNGFGMDGFGLGEKLVKAPPGNGNGRGDEPTFWPNWLRLEMGCMPMPVGGEGEREAPDFGHGGLRRRGGVGRFDRMGWP